MIDPYVVASATELKKLIRSVPAEVLKGVLLEATTDGHGLLNTEYDVLQKFATEAALRAAKTAAKTT